MKKIQDLWTWPPDVFRMTGGVLLAATFVVVPLELGPAINAGLNLTGHWVAVGYALAIVFDLVWMGTLSRVPAAARQRSKVALATALSVAALGIAASVTGVILFGSMPVLASIPVMAVTVHGLGMVLDATLADTETDTFIRGEQLKDRNRVAQADQGARSLHVTRSLEARARVAGHLAEQNDADAVEAALTDSLAAREIRRTTQAAELEAALSKTISEHGKAAEAFRERGLTLPDASMDALEARQARAVPQTGTPVKSTEPAPYTPPWLDEADTERPYRYPWEAPERPSEAVSEAAASVAPAAPAEGAQRPSEAVSEASTAVVSDDPDGWGFIKGVLEEAEGRVTGDPGIKLMTTKEVAAHFGKNEGTIRSWVARGKLRVHDRDGDGKTLFHPNDVAKLD